MDLLVATAKAWQFLLKTLLALLTALRKCQKFKTALLQSLGVLQRADGKAEPG